MDSNPDFMAPSFLTPQAAEFLAVVARESSVIHFPQEIFVSKTQKSVMVFNLAPRAEACCSYTTHLSHIYICIYVCM